MEKTGKSKKHKAPDVKEQVQQRQDNVQNDVRRFPAEEAINSMGSDKYW